jgi:hypothetical protein
MRRPLPLSSRRPIRIAIGIAGYSALVAFLVTLLTTSGPTAAVVGTLTVALLAGSYLLERWARRHTIYSVDPRPSPRSPPSPTSGAPGRGPSAPRSAGRGRRTNLVWRRPDR